MGRSWWSAKLAQRWEGLRTWDRLESALRNGRRAHAAQLGARMLRHPQRLFAVALRRLRFWLSSRRSSRLTIDSRTAAALESADPNQPADG